MLLTFLLAVMGWVLFRADSIEQAFHYYGLMFGGLLDGGAPTITSPIDAWAIAVAVTLMTVVEWLNRGERHEFSRQPRLRVVRWASYVVVIFLIGAFMVTNEMPFIYFQF